MTRRQRGTVTTADIKRSLLAVLGMLMWSVSTASTRPPIYVFVPFMCEQEVELEMFSLCNKRAALKDQLLRNTDNG